MKETLINFESVLVRSSASFRGDFNENTALAIQNISQAYQDMEPAAITIGAQELYSAFGSYITNLINAPKEQAAQCYMDLINLMIPVHQLIDATANGPANYLADQLRGGGKTEAMLIATRVASIVPV